MLKNLAPALALKRISCDFELAVNNAFRKPFLVLEYRDFFPLCQKPKEKDCGRAFIGAVQ